MTMDNTTPRVPERQLTKRELQWAEALPLTEKQLEILLAPTPKKYIRKKPGKGNSGDLEYVSIGYFLNVLNLLFGWDWDFTILDQGMELGEIRQAWVRGRLTVRTMGHTIIKEQYGSTEILYTKAGKPVSIGDALKGAGSDALKKCGSMLGIARDVYHRDEFIPIKIKTAPESKHQALEGYLAGCMDPEAIQEVAMQYELEYGLDDRARKLIKLAEARIQNR